MKIPLQGRLEPRLHSLIQFHVQGERELEQGKRELVELQSDRLERLTEQGKLERLTEQGKLERLTEQGRLEREREREPELKRKPGRQELKRKPGRQELGELEPRSWVLLHDKWDWVWEHRRLV